MHSEGKPFRVIAPFLLGVGATLTMMALYHVADLYNDEPKNKLRFANGGYETVSVSHQKSTPFADLAPLLKTVAADDRTIIITTVNWAWAKPDSLLDLFLESFRIGEKIDHLLKHLLIVAYDPQAFARCRLLHPNCYEIKVNTNFTGKQSFMSKGFLDFVWSKVKLQQYVLEQGYNLLFTDVDILWFRNPFNLITIYPDMTISCDGDPKAKNTSPNTGFSYAKSGNKTIEMMKYWHNARQRFPLSTEQVIFHKIKQELIESIGINIQLVDTTYFGCFCRFSTDINMIYTMHANCCVNGLEAKLSDLRNIMANWKNYTALSQEEKNKGLFTLRKPGNCRI